MKYATINSRVIAATAVVLSCFSLSASAFAQPTCKDRGMSYWEKNVNETVAWQAHLASGLQANKAIETIETEFDQHICSSFMNAPVPTMLWKGVHYKGCDFNKPAVVINGTSIDHGGDITSNPGIMRQSGCVKRIKVNKLPVRRARDTSLRPVPR